MSPIQLVAVVFALAMLYQTYMNIRRRDLGFGGAVLWSLIWVALLLVSVFPGPLRRLNGIINVARLLDLVTIGGLLVLGAICYRLSLVTWRMQKAMEALVRQMALRPLEEPEDPTDRPATPTANPG